MKRHRYIILNDIELSMLSEGHKKGKSAHFRQRCQAILLSQRGYGIVRITILLNKHCDTIRKWYNNWELAGLSGLGIKAGRGLKPRLKLSDENLVEIVKKRVVG